MKVGATLSGGFVKAAAHIGFLKALEEKGLRPSCIAGSSAGALVGFLYSYGFSPNDIEKIGKNLSWKKLVKPSFKGGIFSLKGLREILADLTGNPDLKELKIPFAAVVVNLKTLKMEVKTQGPSADIVTASCCASPLFSPWKIGNNYYIDGGLRNCLPAEVVKSMGAELNICSNVNVLSSRFNPKSITEVAYRSSLASILENEESRFKYCDIIVNHELSVNPFDLSKIAEIVKIGFENTLREVEKWL